jgi:hypothetical protein
LEKYQANNQGVDVKKTEEEKRDDLEELANMQF